MYISGDNITTFLCHVKPDFKPKTTLALKWVQAADETYKAVDRGEDSDVYESEIRIYSTEDIVNNFVNMVYANRTYDTNYFTMSGFEGTEHIFGEDVDYSVPITVTILAINGPAQKTWKGYEAVVTVRALSPTFSYSSALPALQYLDYGYKGAADFTINKYDSYHGLFTYQEHGSDIGRWEGTLTFCNNGMGYMRRYLATERGNTLTIPSINGVTYPWGPYRSGFPITCKVIKWEDLGMWGTNNWKMKLTLAEDL